MFEHRIDVTWGECDLAGLVYFPRMLDWCHRALEALWSGLDGGYATFTGARGLGIPTVRIEGDFRAPVRYGDPCLVRVSVLRIGRSSVRFEHSIVRHRASIQGLDAVECARFEHVVTVCALEGPTPIPVPDDVRALLAPHLVTRSSP